MTVQLVVMICLVCDLVLFSYFVMALSLLYLEAKQKGTKKKKIATFLLVEALHILVISVFYENAVAIVILCFTNIVALGGIFYEKIENCMEKWWKHWVAIATFIFLLAYPSHVTYGGWVEPISSTPYEYTRIEEQDGTIRGYFYQENGEEKYQSIPEGVEVEVTKSSGVQQDIVYHVVIESRKTVTNQNSILDYDYDKSKYYEHYKFFLHE